MMFYIMYALSKNKGLESIYGGEQLQIILSLGNYVIGLFSIIFLFYTNSFLIKRRKKEFGLFNILGMEKRHLSKVMLYETLFVAIISLLSGIIGGILLNKLIFLVLLRILNVKVQMGFEVSKSGIIETLILFGIIFTLTLLNTMRQIHLSNPIELLKGGQTGEKEPKTKWLLVIIGILSLSGGYYISLTTKDPMAAMNLFFIAVILVIIGTYSLFTAGSIAALKLLRKNKRYYYKTKHFISVSGMMYRMKQNAVGLANICILSTMVLVMISTTVSLYIGMEDVIRTRFQRNIIITSSDFSEESRTKIQNVVKDVLSDHKLTEQNILDYRYTDLSTVKDGANFITDHDRVEGVSFSDISELTFIPLEDYNKVTGNSTSLEDDEILINSSRDNYDENTLSVLGRTFSVKEHIDSFTKGNMDNIFNCYDIVVKDMSIVEKIITATEVYGEDKCKPVSTFGFDLSASDGECKAVSRGIREVLATENKDIYIEAAAEMKETVVTLYGGLFFLGIFLGLLFMMATILIIYYKQISEGYDDKERFDIMKKVGMSGHEVKKTIHSQVLTVFFLPLVAAVIHIAFAFKVITKLLAMLGLVNINLFALCTAGTILIFALFYGIVYAITAREYYKIVK